MLKKLMALHRADWWVCLGTVGGIFLSTQLITGIALWWGDQGTRSAPLISGTILPISTAFLVLFLVLVHVNDLFLLALRLGQTRRRALGLTLALSALAGTAGMALSALLAWTERALLPALWLALSGADKLVWGEVPPLPAVWDGTDQGWQALLDELSSTLYLDSFALDWWWYLLLLAIGLAVGLILGAFLQRFGAKGGWIIWAIWMVICLGPQLVGKNALLIGQWTAWMGAAAVVFAVAAGVWSVWSLLHAVVKG